MSIRCMLGFHLWTEWMWESHATIAPRRYRFTMNLRKGTRECKRCGKDDVQYTGTGTD